MSKLHLQGIVFDADGTLFDTERLARTVWLSVAREWKATAIEEHYMELIGRNREGIVALLRSVCPRLYRTAAHTVRQQAENAGKSPDCYEPQKLDKLLEGHFI